MKNPLHYQLSDYDCGPTSMLNGISYLFEREDIPPEIIRNIMLYCLDCYGADGATGTSGTSCTAMMFLSHWLNGFGQVGKLPISSQYLSGKDVYFGQDSYLCDALNRGGAVVLRLFTDEWHYVLLTGRQEDAVLMFDPYFDTEHPQSEDVHVVTDHPFAYNRIVSFQSLNRECEALYALGPCSVREAVLLFNEETKLTEETTIEYFI